MEEMASTLWACGRGRQDFLTNTGRTLPTLTTSHGLNTELRSSLYTAAATRCGTAVCVNVDSLANGPDRADIKDGCRISHVTSITLHRLCSCFEIR